MRIPARSAIDWWTSSREVVERVGAERIGCFVAEPVMGMGGVLIPPPGYFRRLSEICKANDILIVADEVVTGFGRLGEFLASQAIFEMSPDIITCAKGLTSGYLPLGATVIELADHGGRRQPGCRGRNLHPRVHLRRASGVLRSGAGQYRHHRERRDLPVTFGTCRRTSEASLETLLEFDIVGDVRGAGFMFAIENVADRQTRALFAPEVDIGQRISGHARRLGLIVRPGGHLNIFSPPLTMARPDVEFLTETLRDERPKYHGRPGSGGIVARLNVRRGAFALRCGRCTHCPAYRPGTIGMSVPLNGLRAFEVVTRHLTLVGAARELHVTPSAVSHQIRNLERYFGTKLLDKSDGKLLLTREGEMLREDLQAAFA